MSKVGVMYYWIVSRFGDRLIILGPKQSEQEAMEFAYQMLDTPWEIVPLATRDRATAAAQLKAKRLESTGNLGVSIQKSMRQSPQAYKHRWWKEEK